MYMVPHKGSRPGASSRITTLFIVEPGRSKSKERNLPMDQIHAHEASALTRGVRRSHVLCCFLVQWDILHSFLQMLAVIPLGCFTGQSA